MAVMQASVPSWLLSNPEVGWLAVILYLFWEIRGPRGRIKEITHSIRSITVVVRALARENKDVDTELVDNHLKESGTEPGDFIQGEAEEDDGGETDP